MDVARPSQANDSATDYAGQFDSLWQGFDQDYSYFDYKQIDWAGAKVRYRPEAAAATSQDALVAILIQMLGELRDQHVVLINPSGTRIATLSTECLY